ncbi:MAG: hypothetical protein ACOY30_03185 [Bacillota bacterium]
MKDKKQEKDQNKDLTLEQLIEKLKENLLVEGAKKTSADDIAGVLKNWLREDKRH